MKRTHPACNTCTCAQATPADLLRSAADYLDRHGWIQGALFADTDGTGPLPACVQAAIHLAGCGHADVGTPRQATTGARTLIHLAAAALADYILDHDDPYGPDPCPDDADEIIRDWNDTQGRTATEVTTALRDTADAWDGAHRTGGAR